MKADKVNILKKNPKNSLGRRLLIVLGNDYYYLSFSLFSLSSPPVLTSNLIQLMHGQVVRIFAYVSKIESSVKSQSMLLSKEN